MKLYLQESRDYRDKLVVEGSRSGKGQAKIASMYGVHQSTISRIMALYRENGQQLPLPYGSSASKKPLLSEADEASLKACLSEGARAAGHDTECWDRRRVQLLIEEKFKVSYHISHISKLLARLKYTLQKPLRRDYRQDAEKKAQWKKEVLPEIKKKRKRISG
jgi:transposase